MSDLIQKKTTKREFLRIIGLSSASLFASGLLADRLLAEARSGPSSLRAKIPVVVTVKPNAFQLGRGDWFSTIVAFPGEYKAADVAISSVRCEGANVLDNILQLDDRAIVIPYNISDLRDDLPCGFSLPFVVTGQLSNGSKFEGMGKVTVIGADQNIIYHTSTRRRRSCNACKSHAVNKIYSSRQAADENRAHFGCNCRIVEEKIGWQNYVKAFWPDSSGSGIVYDKRWDWPPPSPAGLDLEYPPALKERLRRG